MSFVEAMQMEPRLELTLIGYETVGSIGYIKELLGKCRELGVGSRMQMIGQCHAARCFVL